MDKWKENHIPDKINFLIPDEINFNVSFREASKKKNHRKSKNGMIYLTQKRVKS